MCMFRYMFSYRKMVGWPIGEKREERQLYIYVIRYCRIFCIASIYYFSHHNAKKFVKVKYLQLWQHFCKTQCLFFLLSLAITVNSCTVAPLSSLWNRAGLSPSGDLFLVLIFGCSTPHCTVLTFRI